MKTIEITIGGHKAQFTTKSMTFGGKELLYTNMSHVTHDSEKRIFKFTYDGKKLAIPYEAKDAKVLTAIFSQVQNLEAKNLAYTQSHPDLKAQIAEKERELKAAQAKQQVTENAILNQEIAQSEGAAKDQNTGNAGFDVRSQIAENTDSDAKVQDSVKSEENVNTGLSENLTDADGSKSQPDENSGDSDNAETTKEEKPKKSLKERFARKKKSESEETSISETTDTVSETETSENEPADPEKKTRLKKSLKIFAIVLIVIIAMSAAYYFIFGTSKAPSDSSPNNTESQQYEDIDDLIDDMQ